MWLLKLQRAHATAGIQQSRNSYHQFGQGSEAYSKRFGAAYGTAATNLLSTSVLGASVLHQDPRYFYSGKGNTAQRAWYAVKSAFRAKGDNGTRALLEKMLADEEDHVDWLEEQQRLVESLGESAYLAEQIKG